MGARHYWFTICVAILLGFEASARTLGDEQSAVAVITKLGGVVKRDDKSQGKPVVEVSFDFAE